MLLHLGDTERAIELLEEVEEEKPGEYVTAANLGTAYELAGRDPDALEWIREGIRRNPESHQGTEWLHVKVLEAKVALDGDPRWLDSRTVLGLDFGAGATPQRPPGASDDDLSGAERALLYQLHERLQFISPPDPIVADLLFDLGNVLALTLTVEHAVPVYERALEYGPPREELVRRRLERMRWLVRLPFPRTASGWLIAVAGGAVFLAVAVSALRRMRRGREPGVPERDSGT